MFDYNTLISATQWEFCVLNPGEVSLVEKRRRLGESEVFASSRLFVIAYVSLYIFSRSVIFQFFSISFGSKYNVKASECGQNCVGSLMK